jgi:hypothetical protein
VTADRPGVRGSHGRQGAPRTWLSRILRIRGALVSARRAGTGAAPPGQDVTFSLARGRVRRTTAGASPRMVRLFAKIALLTLCTLREQVPDKGRGTAMRPSFREALAAEQPLILFGADDALSARLIARAGCPTCFISGFSVVAARFGVPDVGLRAFGDISGSRHSASRRSAGPGRRRRRLW